MSFLLTLAGSLSLLCSLPSSFAVPVPGQTNATIGFLWQLSPMPGVPSGYLDSVLVAAQVALDDVNADPLVLPNTTLVMVTADSQELSAVMNGLRALDEMVEEHHPVALLGALFSDLTRAAVLSASLESIPLIGPSSTLAALTKMGAYFLRTINDVSSICMAQARFVRLMGWQNIAFLFDDYEVNTDAADIMQTDSRFADLSVRAFKALSPETVGDTLDQIIAAGTSRIIVAHYADGYASLLGAAQERNMLNGDYVFLAGTSFLQPPTGDLSPSLLLGQIIITAPTPQGDDFYTMWAEVLRRLPSALFSSRTVPAYDAVWVVARGLHSLYASEDENSGENLYQHMLGLEFDALAWPLGFEVTDTSSGNAKTPASIWNYVEEEGFIEIAQYQAIDDEVVWLDETALVWPGGMLYASGAVIPADIPPVLQCPTNPQVCADYPSGLVVENFYLAMVNGSVDCTVCSGLGDCDIRTGACTCRQPGGHFTGLPIVGGDDCGRVAEEFSFSSAAVVGLWALIAIDILACIAISVGLILFKLKPVIRASSPMFGVFSAVGAIIFALSNVPLDSGTRFNCYYTIWAQTLGSTSMIAPFFIKAYRLKEIFFVRKLKVKIFPDSKVLSMILALVALDLCILVSGLFTTKTSVLPSTLGEDDQYWHYTCEHDNSATTTMVWLKLALTLVWGVSIAFATRKIKVKAMRDSKELGLLIYNAAFSFLFLGLLSFLEPQLGAVLRAVMTTYLILSSFGIMYGKKFRDLDAALTTSGSSFKKQTSQRTSQRTSQLQQHTPCLASKTSAMNNAHAAI